jgi:hypothetical protein
MTPYFCNDITCRHYLKVINWFLGSIPTCPSCKSELLEDDPISFSNDDVVEIDLPKRGAHHSAKLSENWRNDTKLPEDWNKKVVPFEVKEILGIPRSNGLDIDDEVSFLNSMEAAGKVMDEAPVPASGMLIDSDGVDEWMDVRDDINESIINLLHHCEVFDMNHTGDMLREFGRNILNALYKKHGVSD